MSLFLCTSFNKRYPSKTKVKIPTNKKIILKTVMKYLIHLFLIRENKHNIPQKICTQLMRRIL